MITKTVLPFKLETTPDTITAHAGLTLLGEFAHGLCLPDLLDSHMPLPGSGSGYRPSEFVMPLLIMLNGGGQLLEDLRQVRNDTALRDLQGLDRIPSSDAVGNWLRRMGMSGGLYGLDRVNSEILRRALMVDGIGSYTLDIDATAIEADKSSARMTYKGFRGYMPMVGHLAENGLGMERMPCGQFWVNAVFFRIGVLAYNLFRMFELVILPVDWRRHQIRTVRWRLYQVAGKVVRHAGQLYLKIQEVYYGLFEMIRRRIRVFTMA